MDEVNYSLADLPTDAEEYRSIAFDGASLDGSEPTPGLPLESARQPDGEEISHFGEVTALVSSGMARMEIDQAGLNLIESFEGFSPVRYADSVGVWTIGYGSTAAVVDPVPATCTRARAQAWLVDSLKVDYEPAIRATGCHLNQHQFNALCSFVYNLGPGSMSSGWRIGAALRDHDIAEVEAVWTSYDIAGGQVLQGLLNRRRAELALFKTPMPKQKYPDPNMIYLATPVLIDGKRYGERSIVRQYEALYPHRRVAADHEKLVALQAQIVLLRKRVWAVAHEQKPASWAVANRGARWQGLEKLSKEAL